MNEHDSKVQAEVIHDLTECIIELEDEVSVLSQALRNICERYTSCADKKESRMLAWAMNSDASTALSEIERRKKL